MSISLEYYDTILQMYKNKDYDYKNYLDVLIETPFTELCKAYEKNNQNENDDYYDSDDEDRFELIRRKISIQMERIILAGDLDLFREQKYFDWIGNFYSKLGSLDFLIEHSNIKYDLESIKFLFNKYCVYYKDGKACISDSNWISLLRFGLYDIIESYINTKEDFDYLCSISDYPYLIKIIDRFEDKFKVDIHTLKYIDSFSVEFDFILSKIDVENWNEYFNWFDNKGIVKIIKNKNLNVLSLPDEIKKIVFKFKYPDYVEILSKNDEKLVKTLEDPEYFSKFFNMYDFQGNLPEYWSKHKNNVIHSRKWFNNNEKIMDIIDSIVSYVGKYESDILEKYKPKSNSSGIMALMSCGIQDRYLMPSWSVLDKALEEFSNYYVKESIDVSNKMIKIEN